MATINMTQYLRNWRQAHPGYFARWQREYRYAPDGERHGGWVRIMGITVRWRWLR